jgi:hypothetical protein
MYLPVNSEQRTKELELMSLAQKVIVPIPWELFSRGIEGENELIRNIHIVLQTEMMLQACIFSAVSADCLCVPLFLPPCNDSYPQ